MTDWVECVVGNCRARVPAGRAPVCTGHYGQVEPGICVENGDASTTTARRFIPAADPECAEAASEPFLRPRRAIRWMGRTWEFGNPMS